MKTSSFENQSQCKEEMETVVEIEATEIWHLRDIRKTWYVDRITNEEVLRRAGTEREFLSAIRKRRFHLLGHMTRKEKIECLALQGRMEGKISRRWQRITSLIRSEKC